MPEDSAPNLTLRKLMEEYGFTREGLAEAVNDAIESATGTPGNCTPKLVGLWLRGKVVWPKTRSRTGLEGVFGRPASELGFRPPGDSAAGVTVRASPTNTPPQDTTVHRRNFVLSGALLFLLPALPETGRLGMSDIARIHEGEAQLTDLDSRHGSAEIAGAAARYIAHVEQAMRRCTYGSRVQTELNQSLGNLCALAGWLSYDSGQHDKARHWWDSGLRHSLLARNSTLQARIWSYMARQAVDLGHGSEAVAIARAALDAAGPRRDPRLSALLHNRIALGHAVDGRAARCEESLVRAQRAWDRVSGEAPPWMAFVTPHEMLSQGSLCYGQLGRHARAVEWRREAIEQGDGPAFQRNGFADQVLLAQELLSSGEVEEATVAGAKALGFLPRVRSPRWNTALAGFRDNLTARAPRQGEEFADRYRKAFA